MVSHKKSPRIFLRDFKWESHSTLYEFNFICVTHSLGRSVLGILVDVQQEKNDMFSTSRRLAWESFTRVFFWEGFYSTLNYQYDFTLGRNVIRKIVKGIRIEKVMFLSGTRSSVQEEKLKPLFKPLAQIR